MKSVRTCGSELGFEAVSGLLVVLYGLEVVDEEQVQLVAELVERRRCRCRCRGRLRGRGGHEGRAGAESLAGYLVCTPCHRLERYGGVASEFGSLGVWSIRSSSLCSPTKHSTPLPLASAVLLSYAYAFHACSLAP